MELLALKWAYLVAHVVAARFSAIGLGSYAQASGKRPWPKYEYGGYFGVIASLVSVSLSVVGVLFVWDFSWVWDVVIFMLLTIILSWVFVAIWVLLGINKKANGPKRV